MAAFDPSVLPYEERLHWQSRADWPAGRVSHSTAIVVLALWGFSIVWCAAIGGIFFVNQHKIAAALASSWTEWVVPILLVGVAVIVILSAIAATISWRNNGRSTLVIGTLPAFVGERFEGRIEAGPILKGRQGFKVTLSCEDVKAKTERRKNSRRRKHAYFYRVKRGSASATVTALPQPSGDGRYIFHVGIDIPRGLPGSLHLEDGTGVQWTLTVTSDDGQSPAFGATYEIPVYRREELVPA